MAKKERKELTPEQQSRKAQREAELADRRQERKELKKERRSITQEVSHKLEGAFISLATDGIKVHRGDAIRTLTLEDNFNGTSTAMLASIAKAAKRIAWLGMQAEMHLEVRHEQGKKSKDINKRIERSINRRVRKGKLAKIINQEEATGKSND